MKVEQVLPCPHCGEPSGPGLERAHMCADHDVWTDEEKDRWRAQVRGWHPWMQFSLSNEHFAAAFGERNRVDRKQQKGS